MLLFRILLFFVLIQVIVNSLFKDKPSTQTAATKPRISRSTSKTPTTMSKATQLSHSISTPSRSSSSSASSASSSLSSLSSSNSTEVKPGSMMSSSSSSSSSESSMNTPVSTIDKFNDNVVVDITTIDTSSSSSNDITTDNWKGRTTDYENHHSAIKPNADYIADTSATSIIADTNATTIIADTNAITIIAPNTFPIPGSYTPFQSDQVDILTSSEIELEHSSSKSSSLSSSFSFSSMRDVEMDIETHVGSFQVVPLSTRPEVEVNSTVAVYATSPVTMETPSSTIMNFPVSSVPHFKMPSSSSSLTSSSSSSPTSSSSSPTSSSSLTSSSSSSPTSSSSHTSSSLSTSYSSLSSPTQSSYSTVTATFENIVKELSLLSLSSESSSSESSPSPSSSSPSSSELSPSPLSSSESLSSLSLSSESSPSSSSLQSPEMTSQKEMYTSYMAPSFHHHAITNTDPSSSSSSSIGYEFAVTSPSSLSSTSQILLLDDYDDDDSVTIHQTSSSLSMTSSSSDLSSLVESDTEVTLSSSESSILLTTTQSSLESISPSSSSTSSSSPLQDYTYVSMNPSSSSSSSSSSSPLQDYTYLSMNPSSSSTSSPPPPSSPSLTTLISSAANTTDSDTKLDLNSIFTEAFISDVLRNSSPTSTSPTSSTPSSSKSSSTSPETSSSISLLTSPETSSSISSSTSPETSSSISLSTSSETSLSSSSSARSSPQSPSSSNMAMTTNNPQDGGYSNMPDCQIGNLTTNPSNTSSVSVEWSTSGSCGSNYSFHVDNVSAFHAYINSIAFHSEISGLPYPGYEYKIVILLDENNASTTCYTVPEQPGSFIITNRSSNEFCLSWQQVGGFNSYQLSLDGQENSTFKSIQVISLNSTLSSVSGCVEVVGNPGQVHDVSVATVYKNLSSSRSHISVFTAPSPPGVIHLVNSSESTVTFSWKQRGRYKYFMISVNDDDEINSTNTTNCDTILSSSPSSSPPSSSSSSPSSFEEECYLTVYNLANPGDNYNITIVTVIYDNRGEPIRSLPNSFVATTAPSTPQHFRPLNRTLNSMCFKWTQLGKATNFSIRVNEKEYPKTFELSRRDSLVRSCVTDLPLPGTKYDVSVVALVGTGGETNAKSEVGSYRDWTVPARPGVKLKTFNTTTNSVCFSWSQQKAFEGFNCNINNNNINNNNNNNIINNNNNNNINNINDLSSGVCNSFTFEEHKPSSNESHSTIRACLGNLGVPGRLYGVSIATSVTNNNITSPPTMFDLRTLPLKLKPLKLLKQTQNSLLIQMECPEKHGDFFTDGYNIEYNSTISRFPGIHNLSGKVHQSGDVCDDVVEVGELISGVTYQFRVILVAGGLSGERSDMGRFTTAPSPVSNMVVKNTGTSGFLITWSAPDGYHDNVFVKCSAPMNANNCSSQNISASANITQARFTGLTAGALHTIDVETHVTAIPITNITQIKILTVPHPPRDVTIISTTSTLSVQVLMSDGDMCTHIKVIIHDKVSNITRVPPCTDRVNIFGGLLDDHVYDVYVYVVSDYKAENKALYKESEPLLRENIYTMPSSVMKLNFSIVNSNDVVIRWLQPDNHRYIQAYKVIIGQDVKHLNCNLGTLNCSKPELEYYVSGLEVEHLYNISVAPVNWAGQGQMEYITARIPKALFPSWGIALITIFMILFILFLFLIIWKRDRVFKPFRPMRAQPAGPMMTITELHRQAPLPIRISEFPKEVELKHKDSEYLFSREFEFLTESSPKHPVTAAEKSDNRVKNRFVDILAFDHSRVKLSTVEMTETGDYNDYINANFIPGFYSKREYIACQGPMRSTLDHFWQMIWDQKVSLVIMLTKLFEKGREKCAQYWPDAEDSQTYGEIQVKALTISSLNYYELRTFQVTFGSETRMLRHFWFLNWPDFGVPMEQELLSCIKDVRQMTRPSTNAPHVIHCSAGVGRTGTYILLDRSLHVLEKDTFIDVFGMVMEMREYRCRMVQTEPQYIFVHDCLKAEILRQMDRERDVVYINESFCPEVTYSNSFISSSA